MNIYRCKFTLSDYDNLESTIFLKADSKKEAESKSKTVYDITLTTRGIPNAKYVQTVTESSDAEVIEYQSFMKKRNNSDKKLN